MDIKAISEGNTALGIEFGSTRIKAVLVDENNVPLASGGYDWENSFVGGYWTYSLEEIVTGLQSAYKSLKEDVKRKYGVTLTAVGAIGISAMMHGYMVFDRRGKLLVPFRTWRNNSAAYAAEQLTALFLCPIPARWSVAHLYQAIIDGEEHVKDIAFQTTLEGFVHWKLTGRKVIGIGEASGMFPVDPQTKGYKTGLMDLFDEQVKGKVPFKLKDILPEVLLAGENAGTLTKEGALLLDPEGDLRDGIPFCPPEGDAGTGMVATNSVKERTGNVSAGTSVFAMIVLDRELCGVHPEIDVVTTPVGVPVAMVHCNNCTSDLNAWVSLFGEFASLLGAELTKPQLYDLLYHVSEKGDADCGGLLSYNYVSNENVTKVTDGRPLFVRKADSKFDLANFMRCHLYSAFGALKLGCDILRKKENVIVRHLMAHGGIFKTEGVAQSYLAAALHAPVTALKTAGEGGAWGMAILANYLLRKREGETLERYLDERVFAGQEGVTIQPDREIEKGFEEFSARYKCGLPLAREAVHHIS